MKEIEKNVEEYKTAIALRDNETAQAKKILQWAKSYDSVEKENQKLKEYIQNIKKRYLEHQLLQQQEEFSGQKTTLSRKYLQKNIKRSTTKSRQTMRVNREKKIHTWRSYMRSKRKKNKNILRIKERNALLDDLNKDVKRNKE